jgi:hypothetical protein
MPIFTDFLGIKGVMFNKKQGGGSRTLPHRDLRKPIAFYDQ